jgi:hypothetical protein
MKKNAGRKILSAFLALCMCAGMFSALPLSTSAAEIEAATPDGSTTVNTTVVGFAGEEWWVIGNSGGGVYSRADSVTLLVKGRHPEGDDSSQWTYDWSIYGPTEFRKNWSLLGTGLPSNINDIASVYNIGDGDFYYAKNPSGTQWKIPNEYRGSTLQLRFEEISAELNGYSPREYALINARTLTASDDAGYPITGGDVPDQKLWPLSFYEWYAISNLNVRRYTTPFWSRSAGASSGTGAVYSVMFWGALGGAAQMLVVGAAGLHGSDLTAMNNMAVRPAFNLDLTNVLFTSAASGAEVKPSSVGSLSEVSANTGAIKFTIIDSDTDFLNLNVPNTAPRVAVPGGTVSVAYDSAIAGADKYVSCVITDTTGNVLYYGKLATTASGTANIVLPSDLPLDSYVIKLFNEQINGDNYTDFSSDPIVIPLTVLDSIGTPPTIITPYLPDGLLGSSYRKTIEATGDDPITWSLDSGDLPRGLTLNPETGVVSGRPTLVGTFTFTVRASNGVDPDDTKEYTITIRSWDEIDPPFPPEPPEPPEVNKEDHWSYLVGYPDGTIRPDAPITREEATTIFFRLITDDERDFFWETRNRYSDVSDTAWSNNAISTMSNAGIVNGYADGTFKPTQNVTRAEFVTMVVRFWETRNTRDLGLFSDLDGHWAKDYILAAYNEGLIDGYEDGTFRPDVGITRAEASKIVNGLLNRHVDGSEDMLDDMKRWPDNADESAWYYTHIQEATNSHYFVWKFDKQSEKWTQMREDRDWTELEKRK